MTIEIVVAEIQQIKTKFNPTKALCKNMSLITPGCPVEQSHHFRMEKRTVQGCTATSHFAGDWLVRP